MGTEIIWRTNHNRIQNVEIFIHEQRVFPDTPLTKLRGKPVQLKGGGEG